MKNLFFENWESIARTASLLVSGYFAMIILLRVSGKRTLTKMNAFDFIVTIALGSTLATVALNKGVPLANGVLAFAILIFLQYVLTWLSVRVTKVKSLITSTPTLIFYQGEFLKSVMRQQRVTVEEVFQASRQQGIANLERVDAIVLETTGDITVIENRVGGKLSTLKELDRPKVNAPFTW